MGPRPLFAIGLTCLLSVADALDNGLAATPPRGFRTWNQVRARSPRSFKQQLLPTPTLTGRACARWQFGIDVNQTLMSEIYRAMAQRHPGTDGKPVSLVDLGYVHAGVDDGWQLCGSGPAGGFHNGSGYPSIDPAKFPDPRAMTALAASLGLSAGWYAVCHATAAARFAAVWIVAPVQPADIACNRAEQLPLRRQEQHLQ